MRPTLLYSIILSLVAFALTPKYVTLNDFEWLEGHFTLYVHYYELPLTNYLLLMVGWGESGDVAVKRQLLIDISCMPSCAETWASPSHGCRSHAWPSRPTVRYHDYTEVLIVTP